MAIGGVGFAKDSAGAVGFPAGSGGFCPVWGALCNVLCRVMRHSPRPRARRSTQGRALPPEPKRRPIHTHTVHALWRRDRAPPPSDRIGRGRGAPLPLRHSLTRLSLLPGPSSAGPERGHGARERSKPSFHHLPLHLLAPPSWRSTCACIRCWCSCTRCSCARCAAWRAVASRSFFGRFKSFCSR